jgi:L-threonylcarbamoyladenylate synthase
MTWGSGSITMIHSDVPLPDASEIREAAEILRRGGLVAFPTETVYGLGANALDPVAVEGIYRTKGRPRTSPLIVHVLDIASARELVTDWPEGAERLAQAFWPGPLTLVLPKIDRIPAIVTAGLPTVGIRLPAHPVAQALLRSAGLPIAAPSANRFMGISPTMADHVSRSLNNLPLKILDGGPSEIGVESTVLTLAGEEPVLLRPGAITVEQLSAVLGTQVRLPESHPIEGPHASPGMHHRHYSPNVPLRILASAEPLPEGRIVWIWWHRDRADVAGSIAMPSTPEGYAQALYRTLHEADALDVDLIAVEAPPQAPAWMHVWDRLNRAQSSQ